MTEQQSRNAWVTWFIALCDQQSNTTGWDVCKWHLDYFKSLGA